MEQQNTIKDRIKNENIRGKLEVANRENKMRRGSSKMIWSYR